MLPRLTVWNDTLPLLISDLYIGCVIRSVHFGNAPVIYGDTDRPGVNLGPNCILSVRRNAQSRGDVTAFCVNDDRHLCCRGTGILNRGRYEVNAL